MQKTLSLMRNKNNQITNLGKYNSGWSTINKKSTQLRAPASQFRIKENENANHIDAKLVPGLNAFCCWESSHDFMVPRGLPAHFQRNQGLKNMDSKGSPPPAEEKHHNITGSNKRIRILIFC